MRFRTFSLLALLYNLGVVAWGAFVRATGSGAGCGDHWPMCNGQVIPRDPTSQTLVEFTHRATSGIALILVLVALVWAFRRFPKGHPVRLGAVLSTGFMLIEAAVGAGIVLFQLVTDNESVARAIVMSVHLVNTFFLLGALTLTAWWADERPRLRLEDQGSALGVVLAGMAAMVLLGITGAVAALGDTLFPAGSLREGLLQDLNPASHFLLRLRALHPFVAAAVGLGLLAGAGMLARLRPSAGVRRAGRVLVTLFGIQVVIGLANLILLAPVWMQLVHLLMADLVWMAWVVLCAHVLAEGAPRAAAESGPALATGQR